MTVVITQIIFLGLIFWAWSKAPASETKTITVKLLFVSAILLTMIYARVGSIDIKTPATQDASVSTTIEGNYS